MPRQSTPSPALAHGSGELAPGGVLTPARRRRRGASGPLARVDRTVAGTLGLLGMLGTGAAMVVIAAGGANPRLVNASRAGFPDWMAGVFGHIAGRPSEQAFYVLLLAMVGCYLLVLACARSLPVRVALAIVVALHLLFLLAPPLLSRDVFNYIAYARLGTVHGLNPYLHGAGASPFDSTYPFICCHHYANPYGPLFTLGSYALAPLGTPAMLWLLKTGVALAALGCVALVWKGARLQGRDPLAPTLLVGLNPVWLVLAVGGAHNDVLMEVFAVGGIVLWLARRQPAGAATIVAGLATKVSAAVVLPFMLVASDRRRRVLVAVVAAGLVLVALWLAVFGLDAPRGFGGAIGQQQQLFSQRSIPQQLGVLFGLGARPQEIRLPLNLIAFAVVAWLLWRTWRGADWIASAGWATVAVLAATAWLLPWYVVWLLPLAALGDDRRLRVAAIVVTGYLIWARTPLILG